MTTRQSNILEILAERQRLEVTKLSDMLKVSKVTIRKDLDHLVEQGLIKREHGFAYLSSSDDINNRLAYHYEAKLKIAKAAAATVQHGEIVMIENGSCCAILAAELAKTKRDVTIITNSAFIADYVRKIPSAKIVLIGGDYQNEAQVMVGPIARRCIEAFFVDKLFIGTDGFNSGYGFTNNDHMRAECVQGMAKQAARIIVLTESQKFSHKGAVCLLSTGQVSIVYTDNKILRETERFLKENGVTVNKISID